MRCGWAGSVIMMSMLLVARAQAASPDDRERANKLFREGRALVKQHKYGDACPKIAAAQKLDPTAGTLLALGDCYERNGQTGSAWTTFKEAGVMAAAEKNKMREREAGRRAGRLESTFARLVIEVAPENPVDGLDVRRNGEAIDRALFGSPFPVDPGEYAIEVVAPGKQAWRTKVIVAANSGLTTVKVPALLDVVRAPPTWPPGAGTTSSLVPVSQGQSAANADRSATTWSTQRAVGVALGGAGVAGIAVGAVFGVKTLLNGREVNGDKHCVGGDPRRCDSQGLALHQEANMTANVSNVAFAAGGAALIAGVVTFVTAPSAKPRASSGLRASVRPEVDMDTARISLRGGW